MCVQDARLTSTMWRLHVQALSVSAVFAGIGSFSSYAGGALWDRTSMFPFQCLCVVLAAAAFVVFELCASALHDVDRFREHQGSSVAPLADADKAPAVNAARLEAGDGASAAQATSENDKGSATTFVAFVFQVGPVHLVWVPAVLPDSRGLAIRS